MGVLKYIKDFTVVKKSDYEEAKKGLDELQTIRNYSRPQDTTGLNTNLTLASFSNVISPVDLYLMARYTDILRNVIPTIRNEIFRNGFEPLSVEVETSKHQYEKIMKLINCANQNEQTLIDVLMEFEDDLQIIDNAYLLVLKSYFINLDKDIIGGEIEEVLRVDPLLTEKMMDMKARLGYDQEGRAIYFSIKDRTKILYSQRDEEGYQTLRACYKVRSGDKEGEFNYYDKNEMLHCTKYHKSKTYGFSQLYSLHNKVMTLLNQDYYIKQYYAGSKVPKGILTVNTTNSGSFMTMWEEFLRKIKKNPHEIHPVINQTTDPSKNAFNFINFMNNLQEMQYSEQRNEFRQQIGALFNVSPVFQNDVSTSGGLNNEGLQITVTNRGVEIGQRTYNDKVLPFIFERNMGITDFKVKLNPSDEIDEVAEKDLRLKELQIAKATAELGINVYMEKDGSFSYDQGKVELQQQNQFQESFNLDGENSQFDNMDLGKSELPEGAQALGDKEPPKGAKVITGPRGGKYYIPNRTEKPTSENPINTNQDFKSKFEKDKLKKINDTWSNRDVYELDKNKVVKVAITARGIEENNKGDDNLRERGILPKIYEKGKDYIITDNIPINLDKTRNLLNNILELKPEEVINRTDNFKRELEKIDSIYNTNFKEILNYDVDWNDFLKLSNWGWTGNKPIHIDEGSFLKKLNVDTQTTKKSEQLPPKQQKEFQTALEKELDEIVAKLDLSKTPSETELNQIVTKITKNLNKRLNAKSANYIKVIYDKSKNLVEKELKTKFAMDERDRNVIEALKRDPTYREAFAGVSLAMSQRLTEIIKQAYDKPEKFTINNIVKDMRAELDKSASELRRIARTETSKVSIAARKIQYDKTGQVYKYKWIGPNDNRTGEDSKIIKSRTANGVTWEELVRTIQEVAGPKWNVDPIAPIPRPNTRHTFIAIPQ